MLKQVQMQKKINWVPVYYLVVYQCDSAATVQLLAKKSVLKLAETEQ